MTNAFEPGSDIRVNSWCELCEHLYANSWQESLMRFLSKAYNPTKIKGETNHDR
jgi:hypothetical protein